MPGRSLCVVDRFPDLRFSGRVKRLRSTGKAFGTTEPSWTWLKAPGGHNFLTAKNNIKIALLGMSPGGGCGRPRLLANPRLHALRLPLSTLDADHIVIFILMMIYARRYDRLQIRPLFSA
jgi:hypothetical protein